MKLFGLLNYNNIYLYVFIPNCIVYHKIATNSGDLVGGSFRRKNTSAKSICWCVSVWLSGKGEKKKTRLFHRISLIWYSNPFVWLIRCLHHILLAELFIRIDCDFSDYHHWQRMFGDGSFKLSHFMIFIGSFIWAHTFQLHRSAFNIVSIC